MSTKITLKHHTDSQKAGVEGFHLYRECFDEDNTYVYLQVYGVPFEVANSVDLMSAEGPSSIAFRLPEDWARKLGLIESGGEE